MLSEEIISLSRTRLELAKERLAYADEIMKIGDYKTVANRSYYAVFSSMRAVLALDGFDSKKTLRHYCGVQKELSENRDITKGAFCCN